MMFRYTVHPWLTKAPKFWVSPLHFLSLLVRLHLDRDDSGQYQYRSTHPSYLRY